ncbi:hypothetical protein [Streptomyces sp. NPDC002889]|uniref:hypothetical protein n=1 Tax=Streptomyces sp. NPDC002889 TaxID=3364669 RepID=UPI0036CF0664
MCALIGMGLGALIRHTATTLVTFTNILLLPFLLNDRHRWSSAILHALPHSAWERLVQVGDPFESAPYPATISGSWIVYAAWPLAAAIIAMAAVRRRDLLSREPHATAHENCKDAEAPGCPDAHGIAAAGAPRLPSGRSPGHQVIGSSRG